MTIKKDRLLNKIAILLETHSADDWKFVAEHLEEVARIARALAEKSDIKPKKNGPKSARTRRQKLAPEVPLSSETQAFSDYLKSTPVKLNVTRFREIAITVGIKNELPKIQAEIQAEIFRHLERLNEKSRFDRIASAVSLLERENPDQSDQYGRWVSLITKGQNSG